MNPIQNTEVNQNESNNDSSLNVGVPEVNRWEIPNRKTRKQWYQSTNPQIRSYITGNLSANISGKGSKSLQRAADEYQYLSEDLARNSYSSKAMSKKYDNFNGIDSSILDKALENEHKQLNTYQQQFNTGQLSEHKFNRLQRKQGRRINNLNENYQTLSEVWNSKRGIPLVRTQSSVSSLPFVFGTIGLPAAIIGGISGGVAAAPYIGKALANPWVQRGLTGLDVVDTGVQVASGNYLGAAANWIPYDKISPYIKQGLKYTKNIPSKIGDSLEKFKNRNIRMTHTTTMNDIRTSISKGNRSLVVPSFSLYKNSGNNLFMYNKGNQPVIFIGNKKILNSPNYIQMKGDQGVPMLDDFDFSKSNFELSDEYIKMYGDKIKSKGVPFKQSRKNLEYVNYNEGKYLGELPYEETSYVIGPDIKEFKEIFKDRRFITYPNEWSTLNKNELRNNLQKLIEELYKKTKDIRLKKGGKFTEYCDSKVTQKCIDKAKKSNNPTLRKRATFAESSRSWSKK